uniref:Hormone-sensitive lipase (HSL) N-terminus n=1 Tax=Siphoviridae sp. ctgmM3 TaxID=2827912 RepID=A0A8S5TL18_9CAUD|nr:MAG TPA: Hormone-sensitive lipase (HSL) N-terminus [Siphoviridae sp. ctgmM3]
MILFFKNFWNLVESIKGTQPKVRQKANIAFLQFISANA